MKVKLTIGALFFVGILLTTTIVWQSTTVHAAVDDTDSPALSTTVVISQAYGGGGGTTGTYLNDYVELKNISTTPQSLNGLSLMYGSATGQFGSSAGNIFSLPNVTLNPGQYYLVQLGAAGSGGIAFPVAADASSTNLNMAAGSGKVALTNASFTANSCGATATPCALPNAGIVDLVSWGVANNAEGGAPTNAGVAITSAQGNVRKAAGCTETDNNNSDFDIATAPVPRNTASTATGCGTSGGGTGLTTTFTGYLNGAQEVPVNSSTAKGFGRVTLNEAETQITVSVSYGSAAAPLSSNVVAGHIHGAAASGVNAPVLFDLAPAGGAAFGSVSNATFSITPAQVANLKAGLFYFNIHTVNNTGGEIRGQIKVSRSVADISGDGRTDYVVVRAAGGSGSQLTWFNAINGSSPSASREWGVSGDQLLVGDYDGDGTDDEAVFRGSNGTFYIIQSATLTMRIEQLGQSGDNARVVGDYDGNGRDDLAVYRPGTQGTWFYKTSPTALFNAVVWGEAGDTPAAGDYDGDGKSDFVVRRASAGNGTFLKLLSGGTSSTEQFGLAGDTVVPGDYDGDGKTDVAVLRTSGGFYVWDFEPSGTAGSTVVSDTWGLPGDVAVQGDYDGDGRTDYAIWRPGTQGTFYVMTVGTRNIFTKDWGQTGDVPAASHN